MYIDTPLFEVKHLSTPNYADLLDVYSKCEDFLALGPQPKASYEMIEADIAHSREENGLYCCIFKNQKLIGVIDFVPHSFEGRKHIAFISLLLIASPYRNLGLGEKIIKAIEQEIRKNDVVTIIESAVQVTNEKAIRFWRRLGYEIESEPITCPDTTVVYLLKKKLGGTL